MRQAMNTALISDYATVASRGLREAGMRPYKPERKLSTYWREYFVEYTTMCSDKTCPKCAVGWFHTHTHSEWNCMKDGFPSRHALERWAHNHEVTAYSAGVDLLVVTAVLRRSETPNGDVAAEWQRQ